MKEAAASEFLMDHSRCSGQYLPVLVISTSTREQQKGSI